MTLYDPNTEQWQLGDIVLHDADEKSPKMLMKVIGYTSLGRVKTHYVIKDHGRKTYINDLRNLHNPKRFGINPELGTHRKNLIDKYQSEWIRCRVWNYINKPGLLIRTTSADGGFETLTTGEAFLDDSGNAMVDLERGGRWLLQFVEAVTVHA